MFRPYKSDGYPSETYLLHSLRTTSSTESPQIHVFAITEKLLPGYFAFTFSVELLNLLDIILDHLIVWFRVVLPSHNFSGNVILTMLEEPSRTFRK